MAVSPFRIAVGPASGSAPSVELSDFASFEWGSNVDDGCVLSIAATGDSEAALIVSELDTDVWLYQGSTLVQRFRISNVEQEWSADGADIVSILSGCYRRTLYRRLLNNALTFSGIGQGTIAWSLIDDTQNANSGDLGITQGTLTDTITRDRTYTAGSNVGELLENLSRVINGPRYVLGGDLVFHALAGNSWPVLDMPVLLGVTARSMARQSGSDLFANVVRGYGDEQETEPVLVESSSVSGGSDPVGRWETTASWSSVTQQSTLDENTNGELQDRTSPQASWTVEVEPTRYVSDFPVQAGDICEVVVPRSTVAPIGTPTTQVTAQCVDKTVTVGANGEWTVRAAFVETPA